MLQQSCGMLCSGKRHHSIICQAKGNAKRGGGAAGKGRRSRQDGGPVPQTIAAAKQAAKRANMFAKQRFERAVISADAPADSSSSWGSIVRGGPAATASAADNPAAHLELAPFVETVVQHLQGTSSSSSSDTSGGGSSGRGRGAKRAAARSLLEAHSAVFQAALDLELQEEWKEAEERLQSWAPQRLASEGVALFGLAASPDGGLMFRDVLVRFFTPGDALPFHSFSQGDIVLVSRGQPLEDSVEGVVLDFSSRWIRLALAPTAAAAVASAGPRTTTWRLDLFANTVSHQRCSEALQQFAAGGGAADGSGQQQQQEAAAGGQLGVAQQQQQEALWRLLAGLIPPGSSMASAAAQAPPWVRSPQGRQRLAAAATATKALVAAGQLNDSQGKAVTAALGRTLTLWQGPPGTGKTTTLLRFCEAAVKLLQPSGGQLLAVAASNVAVDNLVVGLRALGVHLVRLGQPVKMAAAVRPVCMDALAAATPAGQEAAKMRKQLLAAVAATKAAYASGGDSKGRGRRGSSNSSSKSGSKSSSGGSGTGGLWERLVALEAAAAAEVLGNVQVVVATCVGAGDPVLAGRCFEVVVLDEATQAPEPAALVALAGRAQSLVMVGDPQQLPPTVKCLQATRLGLGVSLFDRLQAMGLPPLLLNVQYRMHPAIAEFPAREFYRGLLRSWPKPADRPLPRGLAWPNPQVPVMFVQVDGPESRTAASISIGRGQRETTASTDDDDASDADSRQAAASEASGSCSFFNRAEAAVVARCLALLLQPGGELLPSEVCVITPYSGQVRTLQVLLGQAGRGAAAAGGGSSGGRSSGRRELPRGSSSSGSSRAQSRSAGEAAGDRHGGDGAGPGDLEVRSVDGFQGREKEVVVFSAVRSNSAGRVGFLADARRLNVALTRARRGLVVVGDGRTLSRDPVWSRWLAWAAQQGVVCRAQDVAAGDNARAAAPPAAAAG